MSKFTWLNIKNNRVISIDFNAYIKEMGRMKLPPAFDHIDLNSGENQLFGTEQIDKRHFTHFAMQHHQGETPAHMADEQSIKMLNPMNYIGIAETALHWRIRHGTKDKDTSLAIPIILATHLQNKGYDVDFALAWEKGHGGDYDLDELFDWAKKITQTHKQSF